MTEAQNRMIYLLTQYAGDQCTAGEMDELFNIIRASQQDETLYSFLQEEWNQRQPVTIKTEPDWNKIYQSIITTPTITRKKRAWIKWVAAASIILIIGIAAVVGVLTNNHNNNKPGVTVATDVAAPTNNRAVITLANGSKVYLDSAGNGILAQENNVNIVRNANGEIMYMSPAGGGELDDSLNNKRPGVDFNTIYNPRGSKVISLTLSDGTRVWLNSESSLKYPVAFTGDKREVEITGEAYFEVAKMSTPGLRPPPPAGDKVSNAGGVRMPFIVKKGDVSVTVLGTHFNVNAYDDEESLKVTLLEGSVRVTAANAANAAVKLKPGQQAVLNQANPSISRIEVQTNVDVDEVMSWKNNLFHFESADLKTILKEFARWYDIQVIYEGNISNEKYFTIIQRNTSLTEVLKSLQANNIQFRIEGKKLFVTSG